MLKLALHILFLVIHLLVCFLWMLYLYVLIGQAVFKWFIKQLEKISNFSLVGLRHFILSNFHFSKCYLSVLDFWELSLFLSDTRIYKLWTVDLTDMV